MKNKLRGAEFTFKFLWKIEENFFLKRNIDKKYLLLYKYIIYLGYCEADLIEVCACCIEKLGLNIWSKNFVKREYVNSRIGKGER